MFIDNFSSSLLTDLPLLSVARCAKIIHIRSYLFSLFTIFQVLNDLCLSKRLLKIGASDVTAQEEKAKLEIMLYLIKQRYNI